MHHLPIRQATWARLAEANAAAVQAGWAEPGVFATAVGPWYQPGGRGSLLYVGKSAGPRVGEVGLGCDQSKSAAATAAWMMERKNNSPFWRFLDKITRDRAGLAWTNVAKFDLIGGKRPPSGPLFGDIAEVFTDALKEEIFALRPTVCLFATSRAYSALIGTVLGGLGYGHPQYLDDGWTVYCSADGGGHAVRTRHPQGWHGEAQDKVASLVRSLLGGT